MENEIWKDIPGYQGYYKVSNQGRVKSLNRLDCMGRVVHGCIMKLDVQKNKYVKVSLHIDSIIRRCWVHRLVAMAFLPTTPERRQVNHIDGNPSNNNLSNLEWCTQSENIQHSIKNLNPGNHMRGKLGKEVHNARPVNQLSVNGQLIQKWDSIADAARYMKGRASDICSCISGRQKSAYGYKWQHAS
jgi:hypothetical protein